MSTSRKNSMFSTGADLISRQLGDIVETKGKDLPGGLIAVKTTVREVTSAINCTNGVLYNYASGTVKGESVLPGFFNYALLDYDTLGEGLILRPKLEYDPSPEAAGLIDDATALGLDDLRAISAAVANEITSRTQLPHPDTSAAA